MYARQFWRRMRRRSRLIVALDVTEESKALRLAADTKDYVDAFKVNYPLVLARGMGVVLVSATGYVAWS